MLLDNSKAIRLKIMDYLSRREHSAKEIRRKLSRKIESPDILEVEIKKLQDEGLLIAQIGASGGSVSRVSSNKEWS